jgi:hypothetical protein
MGNLASSLAAAAALSICVPALAVPQDEAEGIGAISDDLQALADQVRPAVVRIAADGGYGSGFAVEDGAIVVTAWHVVQGAETIWIETTDGTEVPATLLDWDKKADAALLTLDEPVTDRPLELSTAVPEVGDTLFAMGHPLIGGEKLEDRHEGLLEWSFTAGMVSVVGEKQLQTTVMLHPGNSGGPMFDAQGRVVGIVVERAGDFGLARKVDVVQEMLVEEEPRPTRRPPHVSPFLAVRAGGNVFPGLHEDRDAFMGLGGEMGMILDHRLVLGARLQHGWMISDEENDAGRPGRHVETSFFIGPSFTVAPAKKMPVKLRIQPYFAVGAGFARQGQRTTTAQFTDPDCNPSLGPCGYLETEQTDWTETPYPLIGGGLRIDLSNAFIDIGATLDPLDPANTVGVGFTFGLRFGRP